MKNIPMKFNKPHSKYIKSIEPKPRRFSSFQLGIAVITLVLGLSAMSYAVGLLTLKSFAQGSAISSTEVNSNFGLINDALNTITTSIANAITTAETRAANTAASLYQPKLNTTLGWQNKNYNAGQTYQNNANTPLFVMIYHSSGSVNFTSASDFNLTNSITIGPDMSANGNTQTVSGTYIVPPKFYYKIDGTVQVPLTV